MAKKIDINGLDHFKEKENAMIASEYSSSKTYAVGDYVYYAGTLYCCTTAITTAEAWTSGHWTAAKLADDCSSLKTAITLMGEMPVNVFDKANMTYTTGAIQSDGTIATNGSYANYSTSDFVALNPNETYQVALVNTDGTNAASYRRLLLLYNANKNVIANSHKNGLTAFSVTGASYIRISFETLLLLRTSPLPSIIKGDTIKYEPYTDRPTNKMTIVSGYGAVTTEELEAAEAEIIENVNKDKTLSITKSDDKITIENKFGSKILRRTMFLKDPIGRNNAVNFGNAYLVDNGVATKIKDEEDDVAPQRLRIYNHDVATEQTIGANHGWNGLKIPSSDHSLTKADIGSVWTDGTTQYVLYRVNDTAASFLFPCTKSSQELHFLVDMPVAELTHVSGATHTTAIPITNASNGQVYPSTRANKVTVTLDGETIAEDGEYKGQTLVITESSYILDYSDMIMWQKAHIGNDSITGISGYIQVVNTYIVTENTVIVEQSIRRANTCQINNSGVLQALSLSTNSGTISCYVNNVTSGTFVSSGYVDMTNYNTDEIISTDNITGANIPDRVVEYHDVSGTVDYGFTMGFLPDIGDSANSKRDDNPRFFDIRVSKKLYPYCFYNNPKTGDNYLVGIGYRKYFTTDAKQNNTVVRVGDDLYVFVDRIGNSSFWNVPIPDEFLGKPITALYENGVVKRNAITDGQGISFYCSSGNGSSAYKISK